MVNSIPIPESYRRVVFTSFGKASDVLSFVDVVTPSTLAKGEIFIKNYAASLNYGDVFAVNGNIPLGKPKNALAPGWDFAGVVVKSSSEKFKVGDEVYGFFNNLFKGLKGEGTVSEYLTLSADDHIEIKPKHVSFVDAAAVGCAAASAVAAFLPVGKFEDWKPGKKILVIGASSGVGYYSVQLGKHLGAHVTGICSTRNIEFVNQNGADEVIDYTVKPVDQQLTISNEFDLIVDCVGGDDYWNLAQKILKQNGKFVTLAGPRGEGKLSIWDLLSVLFTVTFRNLFSRQYVFFQIQRIPTAFSLTHDLVSRGKLRPKANVVFPAEKFIDAFSLVETKRAVGKVVIEFAKP
ncbi:hypothetical protein HK098_002420 [Nowakowskiella sp. JEL0407]|nr:hypothetical protein HK098_002420 [Nowakowskiella sp. JEL0407]